MAEHRAFDFWLGEWDAYVTGTDTLAGRSSILALDHGCVIAEQWRSARSTYSGRSLNLYDRNAGHWRQFWVDSTGDVTRFDGGPIDDGMQLVAEDDFDPNAEAIVFNRMTFTRNGDGSVRQHGEQSRDRGLTWITRYDFTYRRRPHESRRPRPDRLASWFGMKTFSARPPPDRTPIRRVRRAKTASQERLRETTRAGLPTSYGRQRR
ncbi:MAG: hypothetical protein GC189_02285 [Alphaproteobacteria bacterium]|nr:hypothetical protein [Alphaproteobacteria bacterium]